MRRIKKVLLLLMPLLLFTIICTHVYATGLLEITPTWPIMTDTDETFEICVKNGGTAHSPKLFLVMTDTCHAGLAEVKIDFHDNGPSIGDVTLTDGFTKETDTDKGLPPGYSPGIIMTVASLKSHIGIGGTDESIWWTLVPFPTGDTINGPTDKYKVHITLDSTDPSMMIYVYAKSSPGADYDMKVPPTNPGFMVPEPATIAAVATPTLTLLAYALYKRKTIFS